MKIVLDTNVFISGVFFSGPPFEILNAWKKGEIHLILSVDILEEYQATVEEIASQFPHVDLAPWLRLLMANSTIVKVPPLPNPVCTDPDDDMFLACAIAGHAKIIVSGDKALLRVSSYKNIAILTPRQFLTLHLMK